jgi:3-phenylpropionate/trans-cinnamate dioxygenase ferredoxin subunit
LVVEIASVDELDEGKAKIVRVANRELGLIRWRGDLYALRNVCPHMGAALCTGIVGPLLTSDDPFVPMNADYDNPVLTCPWHGWTFFLKSGRSVIDPERYRVRCYPTSVRDGQVLVDLGG